MYIAILRELLASPGVSLTSPRLPRTSPQPARPPHVPRSPGPRLLATRARVELEL